MKFGIAVDIGGATGVLGDRIEIARRLAITAEQQGFKSLWAGESYPSASNSFHLSSPLLALAALAPSTRLTLGTGVTLLPAWHPLRLAYDAAALDALTGGRLVLGVGIGTPALWDRFGLEAVDRGMWTDEMLQALRALWSGAAGFSGLQLSVEAGISPLPNRKGGPPIWVGGRIRRSAQRAATFGDGWYGATNYRLGEIARQVSRYRAECERLGRTAGALSVNRLTVVSESVASAHGSGDGEVMRVLASYLEMGVILGDTGAPIGSLEYPELLGDLVLIGDPDTVNRQLERYAKAGVTHLQARIAPANLPVEVAERTIRLLGREVLPNWDNS